VPLASGSRKTALLVVAALLAVLPGGGCELAVPDTVPSFTCHVGADTCPSDSTCVPATGMCIPRSQACTGATCPAGTTCNPDTLACQPADDGGQPDATVDVAAPLDANDSGADEPAPEIDARSDGGADAGGACGGIGCKCSGDTECDGRICGDQLTVGGDVYAAAGKASFCTRPCCTSSDCDPSSVCFATSAGGNYCMPPQWLSRSLTLGNRIGGQACNADSDCRSGLCSSNVCADTCCSMARAGSQCAPGTTCRFSAFPGVGFDMHFAAHCAAPAGLGADGVACRALTDCQSGFCDALSLVCRAPCGNPQDCAPAHQDCGYSGATPMSGGLVAACGSVQGPGAEGAACQAVSDCQNSFCNMAIHQCTDVCFSDADCTVPGWRCRPMVVQFGGSFSVLSCGS